jgi:AcrR family transcriptional regulator
MSREASGSHSGADVRDKILATASDLFYQRGVRAVGVDLVVEKAGVAKTSLYRLFGSKDDLVLAFLQRRDQQFWKRWDEIAGQHSDDARAELNGQLDWIGQRVGEPHYRGCPQLNIAAEYPETEHPARKFAKEHKRELRRRLKVIAQRLKCPNPDELAGQLAVLINGAIVSTPIYEPGEATALLRRAADALISASVDTSSKSGHVAHQGHRTRGRRRERRGR